MRKTQSQHQITQGQCDALKMRLDNLSQPATLLNLLHTRTDLERVDPCELEMALQGIESLLNQCIAEITETVTAMFGEEVNNA